MRGRKKSANDESKLEYTAYRSWEKSFSAVARSDNYVLFRDHMRRLSLSEKPKLMLDGTIRVIQAISAYAIMDGIPLEPFLNMQQYNPSEAPNARYIFTFDLCGKAFARVLADSKHVLPDLADLFGYPWKAYRVAGYERIWISHSDWSPLTSEELQQLETDVTDDLLFDYSEDELDYWFDGSIDPCYLLVSVKDRYEEGEKE